MLTASYVLLKDVHAVETGFNAMTSNCLHDGKPYIAEHTKSTTHKNMHLKLSLRLGQNSSTACYRMATV